jgi:hypothetical protein
MAEDLMDALREVDWSTPPRPVSEFFSRFTAPDPTPSGPAVSSATCTSTIRHPNLPRLFLDAYLITNRRIGEVVWFISWNLGDLEWGCVLKWTSLGEGQRWAHHFTVSSYGMMLQLVERGYIYNWWLSLICFQTIVTNLEFNMSVVRCWSACELWFKIGT